MMTPLRFEEMYGAEWAELEALVDAHLLRPAGPGRYTFHDLLREYARGLAPAGPDQASITDTAAGASGEKSPEKR